MSKYTKVSTNIDLLTIDNPKTPNKKIDWYNISSPGKQEIEFLRKKFRFDLRQLQASSVKAVAQRPMIAKQDDYLFIIMHFPVFVGNKIVPAEIEFFMGHGYLVTLHDGRTEALTSFFRLCKKDDYSLLSYQLESSAILLYELLEKMMMESYNILDRNSIEINKIEDDIFDGEQKGVASAILSLRRNILNIRKIIQNHKNILKKLTEMKSTIVSIKSMKNYYYILIEHAKRIWEFTDNQKELIEALHDTNESMLNYRISDIMKTLTIFSVIVFPLTLLAALFGMNVVGGMPLLNHPFGFWMIISVMSVGCLVMLWFFERKKWL